MKAAILLTSGLPFRLNDYTYAHMMDDSFSFEPVKLNAGSDPTKVRCNDALCAGVDQLTQFSQSAVNVIAVIISGWHEGGGGG